MSFLDFGNPKLPIDGGDVYDFVRKVKNKSQDKRKENYENDTESSDELLDILNDFYDFIKNSKTLFILDEDYDDIKHINTLQIATIKEKTKLFTIMVKNNKKCRIYFTFDNDKMSARITSLNKFIKFMKNCIEILETDSTYYRCRDELYDFIQTL